MQAEPRENVDTRWRVGSGEKWNDFFVEQANHFELLAQEVLANGQVVATISLRDFIGEALPGLGFPGGGDVFRTRVFGEIAHVDQVAAAFPNQCGTLPGLILSENRGE